MHMRLWLSLQCWVSNPPSLEDHLHFFLSILDTLNVFLSVINLLLEMRGLRIMMTLWCWTQWFLEMTRWQHTAHLCIWECCPLSHYKICFYGKKKATICFDACRVEELCCWARPVMQCGPGTGCSILKHTKKKKFLTLCVCIILLVVQRDTRDEKG